jgi:hypothetical protein
MSKGSPLKASLQSVVRAMLLDGRTPYILRLASNACLDANNRDQAVRRARTIHIFPADEKLRPAFRRLVGKTVVVRGSPFIAHTAHHHAPIVMQVTEINAR